MNLQDKIALLKNEMESRNLAPNANEVWGHIEHQLKAKRRRKRTVILSSAILILLTLSYVFINNKGSQFTPSGFQENNTFSGPSDHAQQQTDSKSLSKKQVPVSTEHNEPATARSENSIFESSKYNTLRYTLKNSQWKAPSLNALIYDLHKGPVSTIHTNSADEKTVLNSESGNTSIRPDNATVQEEKTTLHKPDDELALNETSKDSAEIAKKNNEPQKTGIDSIPQKIKKWVVRPYCGFVFNQLKPFSVPDKPYAYSMFSNYATGLMLDYSIRPKTMLTFNLGFIKLPSKIEFLKKDSNSNDQIIKVLNTNNLITGLEYAQFNTRRNICFNIGTQLTISGKKRNYVVQELNNASIYNQQKTLPQDFQNNYFAKIDFLFNTGISFYKHRSVLRINYYQGLTDVSRTTKLYNPHAFVQVSYAYQLFRF